MKSIILGAFNLIKTLALIVTSIVAFIAGAGVAAEFYDKKIDGAKEYLSNNGINGTIDAALVNETLESLK